MDIAHRIERCTFEYRPEAHPFYQAWDAGRLDLSLLKHFGKQFYHFLKHIPSIVESTIDQSRSESSSRILREIFQTDGSTRERRCQMWMCFLEQGLGETESNVEREPLNAETKTVISCFEDCSKSSFIEGLSVLYYYQHQIPEICKTSLRGLQQYYGVHDRRSLAYFRVYQKRCSVESSRIAVLLNTKSQDEIDQACFAARRSSIAFWQFLDGVVKTGEESVPELSAHA